MKGPGDKKQSNLNKRTLVFALLPFAATLILLAAGWYYYLRSPDALTLRIAAGGRGSESFELATAISEIAAQGGTLKVELLESAGSSSSTALLTNNAADLAMVQADSVFPAGVTMIASLYPEFFQLLTRRDAPIRDFGDLAGKRVALAEQTSGQYRSFWLLANHYGLPAEQIRVTTVNGVDLIRELRQKTVDAVFRVRPTCNRELRLLLDNVDLKFVAIGQGAAIHLRYPALNSATLPQGAYRGSPPEPATDLPTVAIDRLLIARKEANAEAVRELTAVLFEKRRDLSQRTSLAGFTTAPNLEKGTLLPVHEGAIAYYDREKPSFLEANSDLIGVLLSLAAVVYSFVLWIKGRIEEGRKGRIDVYNLELAEINAAIAAANSRSGLEAHRAKLYEMLNRVIADLDEDRVAEEGFHTFAFTWGAVQKSLDDRWTMLDDHTRAGSSVSDLMRNEGRPGILSSGRPKRSTRTA
jgi:TRAP transporter TAXI family solute receptor